MKTLTIVGAQGAGKSTALDAYMADRTKKAKQRCRLWLIQRGMVNLSKQSIHQELMDRDIDQVYIDFEGRPSAAFMNWLQINLPNRGVKFLVIAHGE